MEPLNSKERSIALIKFLGLFLVTLVLACAALYFDYNVIPSKQFQMLKEENAKLSVASNNTRAILTTIDSIRSGLMRYQADPNKGRIEIEVNQGALSLIKYIGTDTNDFSRIITRVSDSYTQQLIDKKLLISSGGSGEKVIALEQTIEKQKQEIKDLNRDIEDLRLKLKIATN
jgi:hypothetical protein